MRIYFDLGLVSFIHFALWCNENKDEAFKVLSQQDLENLWRISENYGKEFESKESLETLGILGEDHTDPSNDEVRESIKLKKL